MKIQPFTRWMCSCGKTANTLEVLWVWRAADSFKQAGNVAYDCKIRCQDCAAKYPDQRRQSFSVDLTMDTKGDLVRQITAQVLQQGPRGYLPKSDLTKALRTIQKEAR
jgi:hypothetical protein